MVTMHVLHKKVRVGKAPHDGGVKLVPFLGCPNEEINHTTGRQEVLGVVLLESTAEDRERVKEGIANSCDLDDPEVLEWVEVTPRYQPV